MSSTLTLMLLRHAKAGPQSQDDHARRLTDGGCADAAALGSYLAENGLAPAAAYVSSAARTKETFEIVQSRLGSAPDLHVDEDLYNASAERLRGMLRSFSNDSVMIVGHNPGIMDAAVALARDGDVNEVRRMQGRFPPCGMALISFDTSDWRDAQASGGRLDLFLTPEDLGGA